MVVGRNLPCDERPDLADGPCDGGSPMSDMDAPRIDAIDAPLDPSKAQDVVRGTTSDDPITQPVQTLVGVSFADGFRAQEFHSAAARLSALGQLGLRDVVIVHRTADGHTTVRETLDPQPGRSAMSGAMWAGLLGLLIGGPVGWIAGAAAGAGAGALAAKVVDLGISDEWVAWFRDEVPPETATVVMLIENFDHDALLQEARRFAGATLVYTNLDDRVAKQLREALAR